MTRITTRSLLHHSSARRGACSEITAARYENLCARLRQFELGAVADLGFVGLHDGDGEQPVVTTGFKASAASACPRRRRS